MQEIINKNINSYLVVNELSKTYIGGYNSINDITFSLNKGETLTILGSNASGKTTILSLIAGLESVSSGEIYLDNKLINSCSIKSRNIGYIDKSLQLDSFKSVKDTLSYPLKLRKFDNNTITEKLTKMINFCELSSISNKKIKNLSLYEKTIVGLARLGIVDRNLYLIDDIFSNLNNNEQIKIAELIKKIFAGKTLICATCEYSVAKLLDQNYLLLLGYSTMIGYGNIHNKEIFYQTIEGVKLINERKVCCIPCKISNGKIIIKGQEYPYNKQLKSDVFDKGIILLTMEKISAQYNKKCIIAEQIGYINIDNVAYFDIDDEIATIYLDRDIFKLKDNIKFSFDIEDGILYDFESEQRISL